MSGLYPITEVPPQLHHHQHQQQRGVATTRGQRLTVHEKKKVSRALMRARRVKDGSIATVLSGEDWRAYESSMRQGLRELDENSVEMKGQGTYASKPLVSWVGLLKNKLALSCCGITYLVYSTEQVNAVLLVIQVTVTVFYSQKYW